MSFNFVIPEFHIGSGDGVPTIQMFRSGFRLGGSATPSWKDVVISGIGALTLVNAKADSLSYLKLFGGTEQLPETYLDTVTLSGGCEQRNLPVGYTQVNGVTNSFTDVFSYINTGIVADVDDMEFDIVATINTTETLSWYIFQSRGGGSYPIYGISGSQTGNSFIGAFSGSNVQIPSSDIARTKDHTYHVNFVCKNNTGTLTVEDLTSGTTKTATGTYTFVKATTNIGLFSNMDGGGVVSPGNTYVLSAYIKKSGVKVIDYISCTDSSNTAGFYDKVTNSFKGAPAGIFVAGDTTVPSPTTPMDIVSNNGALKLSPNLFDKNASYALFDGFLNNASAGQNTLLNAYNGGDKAIIIKVTPNTTYTVTRATNLGSVYDRIRCAAFTTLPADRSAGVILCNYMNRTQANATFTTLSDTQYVAINVRNSGEVGDDWTQFVDTFQVELGSIATPYMPYGQIYTDGTVETVTDSNQLTATAQMLLSVGNYKDTQEVLSGSVTRRIGIKVFDGTEDWEITTTQSTVYRWSSPVSFSLPNTAICSHYVGVSSGEAIANMPDMSIKAGTSTVSYTYIKDSSFNNNLAGFKQYLATQYAQGTPVIVVYPLATATTETVTPQLLLKSPVTQTAGSISNLPIAITESSHTTPTPQQPLDINCNNGVVKYGVLGKNLFDINTITEDIRYNDSGEIVTDANVWSSDYIPVLPSTAYTYSFINEAGRIGTLRINFFDKQKNWISVTKENFPIDIATFTETTPSNAYYIRTSQYKTVSDVQLEQGSTATPYEPYQEGIYADGTTETVEVTGKNLLDYSKVTVNMLVNVTSGALTYTSSGLGRFATDYIQVKPNTSYYSNAIDDYSGANGLAFYDSNKEFVSGMNYSSSMVQDKKFTVPNNSSIKYVRLSCYNIAQTTEYIVAEGSTATAYEPYFNGGTATAEMLLKVGNYQDVQSVLDGEVARNVGVKVLDGTEDWSYNASWSRFVTSGSDMPVSTSRTLPFISTHYQVIYDTTRDAGYIYNGSNRQIMITDAHTTVESWTQWLSDQYNAGTPVIVIYPLATATTETVTPQPLSIQAGTNIVEITQASMDNLELEVSYKAGVAVTITEVQNAQLDNSVEVTING